MFWVLKGSSILYKKEAMGFVAKVGSFPHHKCRSWLIFLGKAEKFPSISISLVAPSAGSSFWALNIQN